MESNKGNPTRQEVTPINSNPNFVKYYNELNSLVDNANRRAPSTLTWQDFCQAMETPLPSTFWINDTDPLAQHFIAELKRAGAVESANPVLEPISWYPIPDCGWRVTILDKQEFRKSPRSQALRQLMIRLTALGVLSRQEEVSAIPPFFLDIKKDDKCLDCCAAPGSKTAQMLVALGRDLLAKQKQTSSSNDANNNTLLDLPFDYLDTTKGFIVANELDEKRSNMLVHQCKRIHQLFPFAIFSNHDARSFPSLVNTNEEEYFDKILCDVMCSGDGILRKAPKTVLRSWKPFEAAQFLHPHQIQVALRGTRLLKVGGRLVYSTCSMNPVENEAVVCQILLQSRGSMRLVDVAAEKLLPGLKSDPGMTSWKVMLNDGQTVFSTFEEAEKWKQIQRQDKDLQVKHQETIKALTESLFPPSAEILEKIPLERCLRLLPHHCNGGGFFIAVFEKVSSSQREQQQQEQVVEKEEENAEQTPTMTKEERKIQEALTALPYLPFLPVPENVQEEFLEEYSMSNNNKEQKDFELAKNLVFRAPTTQQLEQRRERQQQQSSEETESSNNINSSSKPIEMSNNGAIQVVSSSVYDIIINKRNPNLRICAAGLRCLVPGLALGKWKIANEASRIVATGLVNSNSPRLIKIESQSVLEKIVLPMLFSTSPLKDIQLVEDILNCEDDEDVRKIGQQLQSVNVGCVLLQIDLSKMNINKNEGEGEEQTAKSASSAKNENSNNVDHLLWVPCLRARSRLQLLTDLEDSEGLKCRLGFKPNQNPTNKNLMAATVEQK